MRRFRQMIFNGLSMLSLVLCVFTLGLWLHSFFRTALVYFTAGDGFYQLGSQDSTIYIERTGNRRPGYVPFGFSLSRSGQTSPPSLFNWKTLGFDYREYQVDWMYLPPNLPCKSVRVPDWLIVMMTAMLPSLYVRQLRRASRFRHGLCPVCGYDLRATPDRCPECGTIPERGKA